MRSASLLKKLVAGDLRVRLALIVGVMWLLNVVSRQKADSSSEVHSLTGFSRHTLDGK